MKYPTFPGTFVLLVRPRILNVTLNSLRATWQVFRLQLFARLIDSLSNHASIPNK